MASPGPFGAEDQLLIRQAGQPPDNCQFSESAVKGTNNKIKTMKRQAYGFRDKEFFKLKILAIHESKYELVG